MTAGNGSAETAGLGILMDLPLELRAELGSCTMLIKQILELGEGSVVELSRAVNEPVDVLVNDTVVARGEIVAVDENLAIRIVEIVRGTG